eukprot:Hpha_TRINITY_DN30890_c0_g1::TRINITY_DN30890_c0_g1_i1::g.155517::m.155517
MAEAGLPGAEELLENIAVTLDVPEIWSGAKSSRGTEPKGGEEAAVSVLRSLQSLRLLFHEASPPFAREEDPMTGAGVEAVLQPKGAALLERVWRLCVGASPECTVLLVNAIACLGRAVLSCPGLESVVSGVRLIAEEGEGDAQRACCLCLYAWEEGGEQDKDKRRPV